MNKQPKHLGEHLQQIYYTLSSYAFQAFVWNFLQKNSGLTADMWLKKFFHLNFHFEKMRCATNIPLPLHK